MRDDTVQLAIITALVICFLGGLVAACVNPELVDKTTALGVGTVIGGLLGALSPETKP